MAVMTYSNGKFKKTSSMGGSYSGSKQMGDLENMILFNSDSNKIISDTYGLLSDRSSTLYHTYAPVRNAIKRQAEYGVGPGLVFRAQPDFSTLGWSKDFAVGWGKDFQKIVAYYMDKFNFYEKQSILFTDPMYEGDGLLFFERENGRLTDLVELPGSEIDWQYNTKEIFTGESNQYTLGIEHDKLKRRLGIRKTDGSDIKYKDENGDQNLIQFYFKELPRQLRGYPLAYAIINMARNDDTHTDAITHRAVMESILIGTFKRNGTDLNKQLKNLEEKGRADKAKTGLANGISRLLNSRKTPAGSILSINNTEEMQFTDMKAPSNTFGMYKEWMVNYVGMATGTPPEVIMSKYSTSFTAHKGALNDFVKSYMKKRRSFERNVMNVVVKEIAKDAISQGFIKAPGFFGGGEMFTAAYLKGMYLGPVPGYINPMVEVKADKASVDSQFKLRSDIAEQNGYDHDIMSEEWAMEQDKFTNSPQTYAEKIMKETSGGNDEDN